MNNPAHHPVLVSLLTSGPMVDEFYYEPDQVLRDLNFPNPHPQNMVPVEEEPADQFKMMINMRHFAPYQIGVNITEHHIVISANHPERIDQHGYITRQFVRRIPLPADVDMNTITALLCKNGVLYLKAPKTSAEPRSPTKRVLTIQMQRPVQDHRVPLMITRPGSSMQLN